MSLSLAQFGRHGVKTASLVLALAAAAVMTACGESAPPQTSPDSSDPPESPESPLTLRVASPEADSVFQFGEVVPIEVVVDGDVPAGLVVELSDGDTRSELTPSRDQPGHFVGDWPAATAGPYQLDLLALDGDEVVERASTLGTVEHPEPFTIVVLPDTQNMNGDEGNELVAAMAEWTVDTADELNTAFVTQVGDLVDWGSRTWEWDKVDASLSPLDGQLPYSVAFGDHDYRTEEDMGSSTDLYVSRFGPTRYEGYDWYLGASPNGLSHAQLFEAGPWDFLHIALEWEGGKRSDSANGIPWAQSVIDAHQGVPTIVTTHAYVWDMPGDEGHFPDAELEGFVDDESGRSYVGTSGTGIYEELVKPNPQVFMVLNGHYHKVPGDGTDTYDGEYHQVSPAVNGQAVYEMLSNYQSYPNGGDGWLRTITFDPGGGEDGLDRLSMRTYSPVLDEYQTDERSEFHFDLSFEDRFAPD